MSQSANDVRFKELKDMIIKLNIIIENLNRTIEMQNRLLSEKKTTIAKMKAEMALLRLGAYHFKNDSIPVFPAKTPLSLAPTQSSFLYKGYKFNKSYPLVPLKY